MSLRFLADQCVPRQVIRFLRDAGHGMDLLREHVKPDVPDEKVLEIATTLDAVLVSLNGDFADIVHFPPNSHEGVIALQVRNRSEVIAAILERLGSYIHDHPDREHYRGRLLLVEPHRIRTRS